MTTPGRRPASTLTAGAVGLVTALSLAACGSATVTGSAATVPTPDSTLTATARPSAGDEVPQVPATALFTARADVVAAAVRAAGLVTRPTPWSTPPALPPAEPLVTGPETLAAGPDGTLAAELGRGACDTDLLGQVVEYDDLVVVGGTLTTHAGACTTQLIVVPCTLTLARPLGARVVVNAENGAVTALRAG